MVLKFLLLLFSIAPVANYSFIKANPSLDSLVKNEIFIEVPKYLLGPGDFLKINLYKFEYLSSKVKVLPDGTVNLPRINSLYINNLTLDEAKSLITKKFKEIIKNPIVYIDLIEARPIRININGEVQRPGIYSLNTKRIDKVSNTDGGEVLFANNKGWPTVVDALQQAGGLTNNADLRKIRLRRYNKETDNVDEVIINFWDTLLKGGLIKNYEIFDEDSIYVENSEFSSQEEKLFISTTNLAPSTITVRVIGEVNRPGDINVRSSSPIMQAILNAGGFTNKSNKKKITLLRLNKQGKFEKNIFPIKNLEQKNNYLQDRDVIFIDDNTLSKTSKNLKLLIEPLRPVLDAATFYRVFFD